MVADTILQVILQQARFRSDRAALTCVSLEGTERALSFSDLAREALRRGQFLRRMGVGREDPILLLDDDPLELACQLLGALSVGALPAVMPFPVTGGLRGLGSRINQRLESSGARMAVVSSEVNQALLREQPDPDPRIVVDSGDQLVPLAESEIVTSAPLALIQYSSGTTGSPRPLVMSHRGLLAQSEQYAQAARLSTEDVVVSWSPLSHDQGLVGNLLIPLLRGIHTVLIPTADWLRRPVLFFECIHRFGGTLSRWPNFAFPYCARKIESRELEGISLKTLRLIANAGEPITSESRRRFVERFTRYGLRPDVVCASYGLAENSLCVSLSPLQEPFRVRHVSTEALAIRGQALGMDSDSPGSRAIVSVGRPLEGTRVEIVGKNGRALDDCHVGEVVLSGDCLARELHAPPRGSVRTGDLGYLDQGWLYLTGRAADCVIVGGVSVNPEQIEMLCADVPGARPGRLIAFGLPDSRLETEQLAVVIELEDDTEASRERVSAELRSRVAAALGIGVGRLLFRPHGWIEKTSSGKLSRHRARTKVLSTSPEKANRPASGREEPAPG